MSWNKVNKPSTSNWTKLHPLGKEIYDDSMVMYDDPNVFYDAIDPNDWTKVAKPTGATLIEVGMAFGTLGMTYSEQVDGSTWTKVPKPQ